MSIDSQCMDGLVMKVLRFHNLLRCSIVGSPGYRCDYWYSLGSDQMISTVTVFALNLDLQIQAFKLQLLLGLKVLWRVS